MAIPLVQTGYLSMYNSKLLLFNVFVDIVDIICLINLLLMSFSINFIKQ